MLGRAEESCRRRSKSLTGCSRDGRNRHNGRPHSPANGGWQHLHKYVTQQVGKGVCLKPREMLKANSKVGIDHVEMAIMSAITASGISYHMISRRLCILDLIGLSFVCIDVPSKYMSSRQRHNAFIILSHPTTRSHRPTCRMCPISVPPSSHIEPPVLLFISSQSRRCVSITSAMSEAFKIS